MKLLHLSTIVLLFVSLQGCAIRHNVPDNIEPGKFVKIETSGLFPADCRVNLKKEARKLGADFATQITNEINIGYIIIEAVVWWELWFPLIKGTPCEAVVIKNLPTGNQWGGGFEWGEFNM